MKDITEILEDRIEDWALANVRDDKFLCHGCQHWVSFSEAIQVSPNPWSIPVCRACSGVDEKDD